MHHTTRGHRQQRHTDPWASVISKRKRKLVWCENEVPKIWRGLYKPGPDGQYIPLIDRASYIGPEERRRLGPWIDAFERLDKFRDKQPLKTLLRDRSRELPEEVRRILLPDLIDRGIPRSKTAPAMPIYEVTQTQENMHIARDYVRAYQANGLSFRAAVAKAAQEKSIPVSTLAIFCRGLGGTYRALKKRAKRLATLKS